MTDAATHPEPAVRPFEAEVGRVLDLVINALYTNRDIFLRELISNASDACDKLRYEALSRPDLLADDPDLAIRIVPDAAAGTLTVEDNGVGMNRDDLASNLGTVARSGTARLKEALSGDAAKDLSLIGRFGVGFYAAFMAAERVRVVSRKAGEAETWVWESDGRDGYTVAPAIAPRGRGTSVVLSLRDDAKDYLKPHEIRRVVRTYSDHIGLPIRLAEGPGSDGLDKEPERINEASALWTRPKADVADDQYREFYRHVAHAFDEPYARVHFRAEGLLSYTALLFVPSAKPFDLHDPERHHGVKLYVRRVFVTDRAEGLLPRHLRFVTGVVDSEDLELNVSRETLQHGAVVAKIRKALVGRVLGELKARAAADDGGYLGFWETFGAVLKEGLYEDAENRDALLGLARFRSTHDDGWTSLADYVGRMRPGQSAVYTLAGEAVETLRASPQIEACRAKGVEVLLLTDPVDPFWLPAAGAYEGKPFVSLTRGDIDLSAVEAPEDGAKDDAAKPGVGAPDLDRLIAALKASLGDAVEDVRASTRLVESPVCLVAGAHGLDLRLERVLRDARRFDGPSGRVLEINPRHSLIRRLADRADAPDGAERVDETATLLLGLARVMEGETPADPAAFVRGLSAALERGLAEAR